MGEGKTTKREGAGIIALCSLIYFVSYFCRKDFAAVLAGMVETNVLDKEIGGLIGTALFVFYGAGQLVSGFLGDRLKPAFMLFVGLVATACCNAVMPLVPSLVPSPLWMIPVWAVNGFAQAMLWPPIVRILAERLTHERFVWANVVVTSAAHIATILLYLYVPICLLHYSWKTVFLTATIICVVVLCIFLALMWHAMFGKVEKAEKKNGANQTDKETVSFTAVARESGLIPIFCSIVMMGFLRDGIESWLPTLYSEAFNRDASESVLFSSILPVFSILSVLVITALHRKPLFNNEARGSIITFLVAIVCAVPLFFLIELEHPVLRIICLVLAALVTACMHACNFLLISCLPGRFAQMGRVATASGFCNAFTYIGAAISMYGIALVAESFGWQFTVLSWIGIALLGASFSFLAMRSYTRFIREE